MNTNRNVRSAVRIALAACATAGAIPLAHGQAAPPPAAPEKPVEEIVITGSRIVVPNLQSISPVSTISSADIEQTGKTRVEDILNSMPQIFAAQGAQVSNGSNGIATVNLRGLGSQRTIVLVNGRRVQPGSPSGGTPAVDLDFIPAELIQRVEILTGGASSTYGADAVGGVVNFILNDKYQGVKFTAEYGFYNHHNSNGIDSTVSSRPNYVLPPSSVNVGYNRDFSFLMGMNTPNDKGNATFYATYRTADPILQASFDYSACTLNSGDTFSCGGSTTTAPPFSNGRFRPLNPTTGSAIGPNATFLPDGSLQTFPNTTAFANSQAYNFGPLNYYARPDERYTLGAFVHYDVAEHAKVYSELMYMNDRNVSQIAPSGAFSLGNPINPGGGLFVNCDNPLLSAAMVSTWCAPGSTITQNGLTEALLVIGRRNVEGGGRQQDFTFSDYRAVIGVKGDINEAWSYDVYGLQGNTTLSSIYLNDLSWTKIQNSLLVQNVGGVPTCTSVINGTDPACVPWNIFHVGGVTPAAANYLAIPLLERGSTLLRVGEASVTGDLGKYNVQLPTARNGLNVNIGVDWNETSLHFQPDFAFQTAQGAGQGSATLPAGGSVTARELFFEGKLPIVEDHPGAEVFGAEFGYRYSDYSQAQSDNGSAKQSFNASTYKFGLEWIPIHDLRLRGSFQRATRVPNVNELYSSQEVALDGTIDPCAGPTPAFSRAQCARTGVTTLYGSVDNNPANQYNGFIGGNPNLQPEKADTLSFGVALQPRVVPGLRFLVDWFDIKVDNAVQPPQADFTLIDCGVTGNAQACGRIHRDPGNGSLLTQTGYVQDLFTNIGQLRTRGIDFDAGYRFGIGRFGNLAFSLIATHLNKYEVTPQVGITYDCVGLYGPVCSNTGSGTGVPTPEDRFTLGAHWQTPYRGLDVGLAMRYMSSVKLETSGSNPFLSQIGAIVGLPATDLRLGSRSYLDLSASMNVTEKIRARFGANNLLDKDPPINGGNACPAGPCNGNTWPTFYDATGRFIFFNVSAEF